MITALILAPVMAYLAVQGQLQPGQDWAAVVPDGSAFLDRALEEAR